MLGVTFFLFCVTALEESLSQTNEEIDRRGEEHNRWSLICRSSVGTLVHKTEQRCCQLGHLTF